MKRLALAAALLVAATAPSWAQTYVLSQILTFATNFCPTGTRPADGTVLPISQNTALFALLGTTYGGNGTTTFALPDLKAAETKHNGQTLMQCIAIAGIFPSRN
ncbi:MAG: tail fiber protein [Acidisphaera sp.]|nr:tail fiber protein [Acidisphaera sp.]